jgi:predicted lipoprotein
MRIYSLFVLITLLFFGFSCKKKNTTEEEVVKFKKGEMLSHTANQIILPRLLNLKNAANDLTSSWEIFKINLDDASFSEVQLKWQEAVLKFHRVKVFEFGPTASIGLRAALGTFPTDTSKIISNAGNSSVNLALSASLDAIGFPALEYVLYRKNAKNQLIASSEMLLYTDKLLSKIMSEVNSVYSSWNGGYAATFSTSTGTESTSGFSLLINEYSKEYELAKNAKLGIPIGKQSLGIPQIEYVESPFAKISLLILKENVLTLRDLFQGKGNNGVENLGFEDYLTALEKSALVSNINTGFSGVINDLDNLSYDLILEIQNNPAQLDALYTKMQNLVVHLKTDMTSAFGVLITYQDNDGD